MIEGAYETQIPPARKAEKWEAGGGPPTGPRSGSVFAFEFVEVAGDGVALFAFLFVFTFWIISVIVTAKEGWNLDPNIFNSLSI